MEGLIPYLLHAIKKQRPQHPYRCLSDSSTRSYHLLHDGDKSTEGGSSHKRTRSEFRVPAVVATLDNLFCTKSCSRASMVSASEANNGLRHRGFASTTNYQLSWWNIFIKSWELIIILLYKMKLYRNDSLVWLSVTKNNRLHFLEKCKFNLFELYFNIFI